MKGKSHDRGVSLTMPNVVATNAMTIAASVMGFKSFDMKVSMGS